MKPRLRRGIPVFGVIAIVLLAGCAGGTGGADAVPTPLSTASSSTATPTATATPAPTATTTGASERTDLACELPAVESTADAVAFPDGYSEDGATSEVASLHLDRAASLDGYRLETTERSEYRDQTHRFDIARPDDGPWEAYWQHLPIMPENVFGYYIDGTDVSYNENGYYANSYDARSYTRGVKKDASKPGPQVAYFSYEIDRPRNRKESPFYHGANGLIETVGVAEEEFAGTATSGDRTAVYRITGFTTSDAVAVDSGYYAVDETGLVREMCVQWDGDTVLSFEFSQIGDTEVRVPDWYGTAKNRTSDGEVPEAKIGRTAR